ncbi:hypothetical protein LPJ66_002290 [Kickxella alabastrina]|uniref:Uncharacterized protein n=1 Tax=Kickxella alabastrina TaxID=61397 RepID=A0ACC1IQW9_9FUNG|nr:hypothetical protein LPJ66_002290 [Kickxella alabastrina]
MHAQQTNTEQSAVNRRSVDMRGGTRQFYADEANSTAFQAGPNGGFGQISDDYNSAIATRTAMLSPRSQQRLPHHDVMEGQRKSMSVVSGMRSSPDRQPAASGFLARSATMYGGASNAHQETNTMESWGAMPGGEQRAGPYMSPPSHRDGGRPFMIDNAIQSIYSTPPTANRHSMSTAMMPEAMRVAAAQYPPPPMSESGRSGFTPRANRAHPGDGAQLLRRSSYADFGTNDRPPTSSFGLEPQFGRESAVADLRQMNRNSGHYGNGPVTRGPSDVSTLVPEAPGMSLIGASRSQHGRGNSVSSPASRARAIEETRNALSGGAHAGNGLAVNVHLPSEHPNRRSMASFSAGLAPEYPGRDTLSESFAWGTPDDGRTRAGSFALSASGRQSYHEPLQRASTQTSDGFHRGQRASYAGSAQAASAVGSSGQNGPLRAGTSQVGGAARKAKRQSQQPKVAKSAIRSNWYHETEKISDSDLKDQDFFSSDEEDFGKDGVGYGGDMVSQQKLIQKQQREIFDLSMSCKMLKRAMNSKTHKPYESLADQLGKTCASNRAANRTIEALRANVQELKEKIGVLEANAAIPPPCPLQHGMSDMDREEVGKLQNLVEDLKIEIQGEAAVIHHRGQMIEKKDVEIRELQDELARERATSDHWHRLAMNVGANANIDANADANITLAQITSTQQQQQQNRQQRQNNYPASELLSYRMRAGTATTASETVTLKAPSEVSGGGSAIADTRQSTPQSVRAQFNDAVYKSQCVEAFENMERMVKDFEKTAKQSEAKCIALTKELEQSKDKCGQLKDELKLANKSLRDNMEQLRLLRLELKISVKTASIANSEGDAFERVIRECEALKDQCESLADELNHIRGENAELVERLEKCKQYESEENREGTLWQNSQIENLKNELRISQESDRMTQDKLEEAMSQLALLRGQFGYFFNDILRPYLRETQVGQGSIEELRRCVIEWSQARVPSALDGMTTPTNQRGRGIMPSYQPPILRYRGRSDHSLSPSPVPSALPTFDDDDDDDSFATDQSDDYMPKFSNR